MLSPGPVFPFEESAFSHPGGQGSVSAARRLLRPPGLPQVSHQASPANIPPSPQLLMPMIKGTVMPLQCIIRASLCGQGVPAPRSVLGRKGAQGRRGRQKPLYSRVRLGVKGHPAQLPIPQRLRAHL